MKYRGYGGWDTNPETVTIETTEVNGLVWEIMRPRDTYTYHPCLQKVRIADVKGQYTVNRVASDGELLKTRRREVYAMMNHFGVSKKVLSEKMHDPKEALVALGMSEFQMWAWASRFEFDLSPRKEVIEDRTDLYDVYYHYGDPADWQRRRQNVRIWPNGLGDKSGVKLASAEEWIDNFMHKYSLDPDSIL